MNSGIKVKLIRVSGTQATATVALTTSVIILPVCSTRKSSRYIYSTSLQVLRGMNL